VALRSALSSSWATQPISSNHAQRKGISLFQHQIPARFRIGIRVPVVLLLLARIGVVDARTLARQRKYAILLIFIFAAVVTPPDLISQVIMALPLMGLYELSILLAKVFGKKHRR